MIGGFRLAQVRGIDVHVDWSLMFIIAMVAFNLGLGVLPLWHPDWSEAVRWLVAVMAALMFVASVLAHEMSHALVARAHGIPVRRVTLFIFGGVASIEREPNTPRAELLIAGVGPLVSLVLGLGCLGMAMGFNAAEVVATERTLALVQQMGPVSTVLAWLGPVNLVLALFNMVPAFPLDGGRVMRALLWALTRNRHLATHLAARTGQVFGIALLSCGVMMALGNEMPLLGTGLMQGLWTIFIAWFLLNAASSSVRQARLQELLSLTPVDELMRTELRTVHPRATLRCLVDEHFLPTEVTVLPVIDDGRWVGMVSISHVDDVRPELWERVSVADVMTPAGEIAVAHRGDHALHALRELGEQDASHMPVVDDGKLLGLLWQRDIIRHLERITQAPGEMENPAMGT